jgi:hypothetical protein
LQKKKNMAIVYEHLRNDTKEVFYVGIGVEEGRAYVKDGRNPHWKNIVNKVGYTVNIIYKDIEHEEAKKIEMLLIEKYGRRDLGTGNLVNLTDGGEGCLGVIVSEETRQKLSEAHKGENNGFFGKKHSEETRQKYRDRTYSEETRQKMSEAKKGKTRSEDFKKKNREYNRNKEGVKGYYFKEKTNKYYSNIHVMNKTIYLGSFDTPGEAAEAYQKARLIYFV